MKCCIVGAGAIGGHLAVKLRAAGHDVSVIARGAQLAAIRSGGLMLEQGGQELRVEVRAADTASALGPQDLVFVTTKATALAAIAPLLPPLLHEHTSVAFLQNGMTWWYPRGLPAGRPLPAELPVFGLAGTFFSMLRPQQVLGGIVYSANEVVRPGVVRNNSAKNGVELAHVDDSDSASLREARALLREAGLDSPEVEQVRTAVWAKLVGNACASPLCVALGDAAPLVQDAAINAVLVRSLRECLAVAAASGYPVEDRFDFVRWTKNRPQHPPSMLQDFRAGRAMEIGEIVLAPIAFARAAGVDTPTLDAVGAIAARLAAGRGLFSPP